MSAPLSGTPLNPSTLPFTYPDALCFDDIDPLGRETTSDLQTLVQDVYHSLLEELDSNLDCVINGVHRGVGIQGMLSSGSTDPLQTIERRVSAGILQDDRISTVQVTITEPDPDDDEPEYTIGITLGVGTVVLGLNFSFDASLGLQFNGWQVQS